MSKKRKASMKSKEYWDVNNWLWDGLDSDDELLIAYNRKPSEEMTSMCALCYQWFKSSDEFHNHMVTHIDTSRFHECSICRKKFLARFLRMRHESIHRYDSNHPYAAYWATPHTDFPADYFVKNHPMKRFKPIPYTPQYLKDLRRFTKRTEAEPISCIDCEGIFQDYDELQQHYDVVHAIQECVHCDQVLENFEAYEVHLKEEHDLEMPMNYPGGRWQILDDLARSVREERERNVANLKFFHNYASSTDYPQQYQFQLQQSTLSRPAMSASKPRASYTRNTNSILKQSVLPAKSPAESSTPPSLEPHNDLDPKNDLQIDLIEPVNTTVKADIDAMLEDTEYYEGEDDFYIPEVHIKEEEMPGLRPIDEIEWVDPNQVQQTSFPCQVCGRVFSDEKMRNRHRRLHNVPGDKPFECKFCKKGFATHSNRKEHERIHTGERPYKCPVCDRRFIQISNLKKHIQTHKDLNNLQCTTCGKQFVKESSLILHQRSHATERKFRCNVCDRAYNYASLLKRHMRIHTGECPYQCPECHMPFHELVSLHYHRKKMHTGERPHKCEICGRGFILSSDLKKHHRVHLKGSEKDKLMASGLLKIEPGPKMENTTTNGDSICQPKPPTIKIRDYVNVPPTTESKPSIKSMKSESQSHDSFLAELDELDEESSMNEEEMEEYLQMEDLNPEITLIVQNDGSLHEDGSFHYEIRDLNSMSQQSKTKNHQNTSIRIDENGKPNISSVEFEAIDANESKELQILSIKEVSRAEERHILETNSHGKDQSQGQSKAQDQGQASNTILKNQIPPLKSPAAAVTVSVNNANAKSSGIPKPPPLIPKNPVPAGNAIVKTPVTTAISTTKVPTTSLNASAKTVVTGANSTAKTPVTVAYSTANTTVKNLANSKSPGPPKTLTINPSVGKTSPPKRLFIKVPASVTVNNITSAKVPANLNSVGKTKTPVSVSVPSSVSFSNGLPASANSKTAAGNITMTKVPRNIAPNKVAGSNDTSIGAKTAPVSSTITTTVVNNSSASIKKAVDTITITTTRLSNAANTAVTGVPSTNSLVPNKVGRAVSYPASKAIRRFSPIKPVTNNMVPNTKVNVNNLPPGLVITPVNSPPPNKATKPAGKVPATNSAAEIVPVINSPPSSVSVPAPVTDSPAVKTEVTAPVSTPSPSKSPATKSRVAPSLPAPRVSTRIASRKQGQSTKQKRQEELEDLQELAIRRSKSSKLTKKARVAKSAKNSKNKDLVDTSASSLNNSVDSSASNS